jgi:FeS assembly SUF system protein
MIVSGNGELDKDEVKQLEDLIIAALKEIYDPEIPVDIFELGLIYEVKIKKDAKVEIDMTLTSPNCPVAESLPVDVKNRVELVEGVEEATVKIVFDPPWDKDMMSEEAQLELGFL